MERLRRRRVVLGSVGTAAAHRRAATWRRALERRLRARLRAPVAVQLHDNTHTLVSFARERTGWRLRLHHMFLAAPAEVVAALAAFVRGGHPRAFATLDRYIDRHRGAIRRMPPAQLRRRLRIQPFGAHHDLEALFDRLNRRYFAGELRTAITYGPAPRVRLPRQSIKLGSYSAEARLIRIHPVLDRPGVPRFFVEWIVFHEMLHAKERSRRMANGKRCVHTASFREHERRFRHFDRAAAWEAKHLGLLLRARVGSTRASTGARSPTAG